MWSIKYWSAATWFKNTANVLTSFVDLVIIFLIMYLLKLEVGYNILVRALIILYFYSHD